MKANREAADGLGQTVMGGMLVSLERGGDWDASAEGEDWEVRVPMGGNEPVIEVRQWGGKKIRKFRICLVEEA